MKILLVATTRRPAGGTFHARKLSVHLSATLLSAELPLSRLIREVWRSRADLLHFEVEYATYGTVVRTLVLLPLLVVLRRIRGPVAVTLHGVITRESLVDFRFARLALTGFRISYFITGSFASAIIVQSVAMREALISEYGLRKVFVIPHGSDTGPSGSRHPEPHRVAFFGFVRPSKGLEPLIRAVANLREAFPDIQLVVAGSAAVASEANYVSELQDLTQQLSCSAHVVFVSRFIPDTEKSALVSAAQVLALPYTDRYVEVSGVVHDFMGYGVPLIVSDRPRFSELEDGTDCLKVQPDPGAIASALRRVFDDPVLAQRISENLRTKAAALSWDRIAELHRQLYAELVAGTADLRNIRELVAAP